MEVGRSDRIVRLATAGTLAFAIWLPISGLAGLSTFDAGTGWAAAAVGTVALGALHFRHVWFAVRGVLPPYWIWSLPAMLLIVVALVPFASNTWGRPVQMLAASVVVLLPFPWSFVAATAIAVAISAFAVVTGFVDYLPWVLGGYLTNGAGSGILAHLVVALRRLRDSRTELAQNAVVRERLRIDAQLRATVGAELATVVDRGERAVQRADPGDLRTELIGIARHSRQALADVRQAVRGYQQTSLQAELDTAVTLLAAAGVEATVLGEPAAVAVDLATRDALRAELAALLRTGSTTRCVIEVVPVGRPQLRIRVDGR